VFSIGNFTRHSEITAAKASGISFYRLAAPIILGALLATGLDLTIAELSPIADARRNDLIGDTKSQSGTQRYNFAFAAEYGRVYKAQQLDVAAGQLQQLQIERKGNGRDYPTVLISAQSAQYVDGRGWTIRNGVMHVISDSAPTFAMNFETMHDSMMTERPVDMMAKPRDPQEMRYAELSRFIRSLERSGGDASVLRVKRALKIAIPVACLVIALFGAPLATSTQRGGTAYGIGLSLAITVTYLMLIQLTQAIGGKGLIRPDLAAWIPNALFAVVGIVLLTRVRT